MKKIILFIALIVLGMHCYAQTDDTEILKAYVKPHFYTSVEYYGFGLDMDFEHQVLERMYIKADLGVYYAPKSERTCGTAFSIALKYMFNDYLFALFDIQPNMRLHGVYHQVNGDYLTFYIRGGVGIGAQLDFNEWHQVYMDAKVCGDFVLYDETRAYNGGVYLVIGVGYKYRFF